MSAKNNLVLVVDDLLCLACGACVGICAFNALTLNNRRLQVDHTACEACRLCGETCPLGALALVENLAAEAGR